MTRELHSVLLINNLQYLMHLNKAVSIVEEADVDGMFVPQLQGRAHIVCIRDVRRSTAAVAARGLHLVEVTVVAGVPGIATTFGISHITLAKEKSH